MSCRCSVLLELFAAAHGFELERLTDAVLPAMRHAVGRGLLHPTADHGRSAP